MKPPAWMPALAGLLVLGGPAHGAGQAADVDGRGPGATVPFVAQGVLLCGGASAAMIERYWGSLGVYAEDYAHLVSEERRGILTGDLADALGGRGYGIEIVRDDPDDVLARVGDGLPAIALLSSGVDLYHYVVVVAVGDRNVVYHDPQVAPLRTAPRAAFLARWSASDFWSLIAWPDARRATDSSSAAAPSGAADPATGASPAAGAPLPAELARAMEDLRERRPAAAAAAASGFLAGAGPTGAHRATAVRILATARYLDGDPEGALDAWNADGAPTVDLVRIDGLDLLRHHTVAGMMGVRPRSVLTRRDLRTARRRLAQTPPVLLGRVEYRPLRDGTVQLEAALLERRRFPFGPVDLAGLGVGALVSDQAAVGVGPLFGFGDRWRLSGGWETARRSVAVAMATPAAGASAVVTVSGGWEEERFAPDAAGASPAPTPDGPTSPGTEERRWARLGAERWFGPDVRLGASAGLERWRDPGRVGRFGLSALGVTSSDVVRLGGEVDGWLGSGRRWARVRTGVRVRVATPSGTRAWRASVGGTLASSGSPPLLWDGAGVGRVRAPLLRGHRLVRSGRIDGAAFGRGLVHGTVGHAWIRPFGPGRIELELFADAARSWDAPGRPAPRTFLDPGVEVRLAGPGGGVAVSLARGGSDWVLAARVGAVELPWLDGPALR